MFILFQSFDKADSTNKCNFLVESAIYLILIVFFSSCNNKTKENGVMTVSDYLEKGSFQKSIIINDTTVILANDSFLVLETKNGKDTVEKIVEFLGVNCRNCDRAFCENRRFIEGSCFLCHHINAKERTMDFLTKTKLDSIQLKTIELFNTKILEANGGMPTMISKSYFKRVGWHDKYLLMDEKRQNGVYKALFSNDSIKLKDCGILVD